MVEKHHVHLTQSFIRDAVRATALQLAPIEASVSPLRPEVA